MTTMVLESKYEDGRLWWLEGGRVWLRAGRGCGCPLSVTTPAWVEQFPRLTCTGETPPPLPPFRRCLAPEEVAVIVATVGRPGPSSLHREEVP